MKKFFVSAVVLLGSLVAFAGSAVTVESISKVSLPEGTIVGNPTISPDGSFVVISNSSSISKVDLATGAVTKIANANQPNGLAISADGSQVAFREPSFKGKFRYVGLKTASLADGRVTEIVKPSRKLNGGVAFSGNTINAIEGGKLRAKSLDGTKTLKAPVASINYGHLDITVNGRTTTIDPQGRSSYLWPSISPDGTKVLYWCSGLGCFYSNLDGSDSKPLGCLRAAVWAGNDMVVGELTHDDGEVYTDGAIIASDLQGNQTVLTPSSLIATTPTATLDGSKVAFIANGDLYIINLKK